MLIWENWSGGDAAWDDLILQFPDYNVYQSHAWGLHKGRSGWNVLRMKAVEFGKAVAAAQVLVRRYPFDFALAWVPGGPVGAVEAWGPDFRSAVKKSCIARRLYFRICPTRSAIDEEAQSLAALGWQRPAATLNSGISLAYDVEGTDIERAKRASSNWRHNLRRGAKRNHAASIWESPNPDEMFTAYSMMESIKNLRQQYSRGALASILDAFGRRCIVVRCEGGDGKLLAIRGALVWGTKAWDTFAVATPEGRKVYASYTAFWELTKQCAAKGVSWYDMSGADPVGNKGVYDFKKGSGASEFRYLGEWDWATSELLRRIANCAIRFGLGRA